MNILIIAAEVGFLIFAFSLLSWLAGIAFKTVAVSWLKRRAESVATPLQNVRLFLLLACVGLCFLIIIVNGVLVYQGKSVWKFQLNLIRSIPTQFWLTLATASIKSVSLLLLVKLSLPLLYRLLDWGCNFAKNYDRITTNNESIEAFFTYLKRLLRNCIWILAGILCLQFFQVPEVIPTYLFIALKSFIAIAIGRLLIKSLSVLVDTLDALSTRYSSPDNLLRHYER
ncbi:MAG TPA: mechanosensitive ion channel protein MscS, partial [Cyanobacteria bacterium UBA11049]|nr:mechanosensitive ion channel protein MscS [Cyanobacteria bacterium UBA11049]